MKLVLSVLLLLLPFLRGNILFAQKIDIRINEDKGVLRVNNPARIDFFIVNDTDADLKIFRNAMKEYGGSKKRTIISLDGTEILNEGNSSDDSNGGFGRIGFLTLAPGEEVLMNVTRFKPTTYGLLKITYKLTQDPATFDMRRAQGSADLARAITPFSIEGNLEIELTKREAVPLVRKNLTEAEVKKQKSYKNLDDVPYDPGSYYNLSYTIVDPDSLTTRLAVIGELKNLKFLTLHFNFPGNVEFPASFNDLNLLRFSVRSDRGRVSFPEGFLATSENIRSVKIKGAGVETDFLEKLPGLKTLILKQPLPESEGQWLGKLTNLEFLELSGAGTSLPAGIVNCKKIHTLVIKEGNLTSIDEVTQIDSLRSLRISKNKITALPENIGDLVRLRQLWIDKNLITEVPASISNLINLEWLQLKYNRLTSLPGGLEKLTKLRGLDCEGNRFKSIPATIYASVVPDLRFRQNEISVVSPGISKMPNLRSFDMSGNQLTELPEEFMLAKKMRNIYVNDNLLTMLPADIGKIYKLNIQARNNQITKLPESLLETKSLKLDVSGNPISRKDKVAKALKRKRYITFKM